VAGLWLQAGGDVTGFTRTNRRHAALKTRGVQPQLGSPIGRLDPHELLLLALPGHKAQLTAIEALTRSSSPPPARTVLISTTGYYGMSIRGVINEDSAPGTNTRAASIAATERAFWSWVGSKGLILRLGGLYSRGRGPLPALARRGAPLLRPPDKPMALIHYDDAATAISTALQQPTPANVYLAVTPPCPTRQEFYRLACQRLKLPEPEFAAPLGYPPATYEVMRLRQDLLPVPAYPDWHSALEL
jgi:nucleoside-diphosphate-sugar epimerase